MEKSNDKISWIAKWRIDKFHDPTGQVAREMQKGMSTEAALSRFGEAFICTEKFDANLALNEGLGELIDLICGLGTPTKWDNTNARLGVGDSNTAAAATQTGLQAINQQNLQSNGYKLPCNAPIKRLSGEQPSAVQTLTTHGKNTPLLTLLTIQERTSTVKLPTKALRFPAKPGR